jgi:hypothetical protein
MSRHHHVRRVLVTALVGLASTGIAACSPLVDDDSVPAPTTVPVRPASTDPGAGFDEGGGLPGLDDDDAFCRAYALFGGSEAVLAVAITFGGPDETTIRAEIVAAPSISGGADDLLAALPRELEDERELLESVVVGPVRTRARAAIDALRAGGVTDDGFASLEEVWLGWLERRDASSFRIDLPDPIPGVDAGALDVAISAYVAAVPPYLEDPSIGRGGARTPKTAAYVANACPEVAGLVIGEAL